MQRLTNKALHWKVKQVGYTWKKKPKKIQHREETMNETIYPRHPNNRRERNPQEEVVTPQNKNDNQVNIVYVSRQLYFVTTDLKKGECKLMKGHFIIILLFLHRDSMGQLFVCIQNGTDTKLS